MAAKPKLTPEQWASTRATWEADPREGYAWLVDELALPVSAPGVRKTALKDGWSKPNTLDSTVLKVKVSKVSMVSQKNHTKVSKTIKGTIGKTIVEAVEDDAPVELIKERQGNDFGLPPNQERFVQEYIIDLNATRAYLEAHPGVKGTTARTEGSRYLANPDISAAIKIALDARAEKTGVTSEWVVEQFRSIANADTRDLVAYHVGCCRYCWGKDHLYQRTNGEMERDRSRHDPEDGGFDEQGGAGFSVKNDPNPDCPACGGEGKGRSVIKDTRKMSKEAAALYAGVKQSKDGSFEVKIISRDSALDKLARHTGTYEKDNEQKGEGSKITREELAALYIEARATADASREAMIARRKQFEADDAKEAGEH